jgi:hypothetical protein
VILAGCVAVVVSLVIRVLPGVRGAEGVVHTLVGGVGSPVDAVRRRELRAGQPGQLIPSVEKVAGRR